MDSSLPWGNQSYDLKGLINNYKKGCEEMSAKTSADVLIGGNIYTLSGYESEEYLHKVASYINGKINEFDGLEGYKRLSADMKATLLELNIADDYFKAKSKVEMMEEDSETADKELYDLKHELIQSQIKHDTLEEQNKDLEVRNRELSGRIAKLEKSLNDQILNSKKSETKSA